MPNIGEQIAKRIRELRLSQKLTQEQLAEQANIDPSVLSRIERGTRTNIRITTLDKLIHALNTDYQTLFSFTDSTNNHQRIQGKLALITDEDALQMLETVIDYTLKD